MILAVLAKFLTQSPPLVQSIVVGLCAGLFVTTATSINDRKLLLNDVVAQVIVVGVVCGVLFFIGLRVQRRNRATEDVVPWVYGVYATVWLGALVAAVAALLGEGGFKVAALSIIPLVLLGPPAFLAFRFGLRRLRH